MACSSAGKRKPPLWRGRFNSRIAGGVNLTPAKKKSLTIPAISGMVFARGGRKKPRKPTHPTVMPRQFPLAESVLAYIKANRIEVATPRREQSRAEVAAFLRKHRRGLGLRYFERVKPNHVNGELEERSYSTACGSGSPFEHTTHDGFWNNIRTGNTCTLTFLMIEE